MGVVKKPWRKPISVVILGSYAVLTLALLAVVVSGVALVFGLVRARVVTPAYWGGAKSY